MKYWVWDIYRVCAQGQSIRLRKKSFPCTSKKEKAKAKTVPLGNNAILDVVLYTKGSIFLGVFLGRLKITFSMKNNVWIRFKTLWYRGSLLQMVCLLHCIEEGKIKGPECE